MNVILRNFLSLALGRYVAIAIGAVVAPLLARALGVEDYGRFIAALAASQIFAAFLDLGLTRILVKEGAAERERVGAHLGNILLVKGVLALAVLALVHLYALREGWASPLYRLTMLLALCKVADNFNVTFDGVFQVFQRMEFSALILVTGRVALLAAVLVGWAGAANLLYFGWAYFLVSLGTAVATVLISGVKFARPRRGDVSLRETVGREGVFFALSSLLMLAGSRLDVVILKEWADAETLGLYAVVAQVMAVFQVLPQVMQTSVLPQLFYLGRHDRAGLQPFYASYLQRSLLLAQFPILWGLFHPEAIAALFGADFVPAAPWLRLLVAVLGLRFVSLAAGNVLTALDRQWERTIWTALGVGTSLVLLLVLVPTRGAAGCITALWVGETLMALLNLAAAARLGYRPAAGPVLRALSAAALAALLLWFVTRVLPLEFFSSLAVTALVVSLAILLTRAARWEELRRILQPPRSS